MNKVLQNLKYTSLRSRILLTISVLSIIRLGSFLPIPYLDKEIFTTLFRAETSSLKPLTQILNTFSGGENTSFGLLSLGILPYINASIIVQLLTNVIPALGKMQKEEGEYGRRKLTDYIRYLTFLGAIIESISLTYNLRSLIFDWNLEIGIFISVALVTGSMIVLWFSELITRDGVGNGSSLLICFNIVSSLPDQITSLFTASNNQNYNPFLLGAIFLITTVGCIFVNEAIIQIPLISARQLLKVDKFENFVSNHSILPLRINQAGVMPLVFTSYAIVLFSSIIELLKKQINFSVLFIQVSFFDTIFFYWITKIIFWIFYASLIFFFTYFYSTIILSPKDVTERFTKSSVVIIGVAPGPSTRTYLSKTLRYIAKINALFLIFNIIGLQVIESILNLNILNLRGLGFTSQLILVNVLIDTVKRIRSFLSEEENIL
jgi:preprotein translocase subunit SecY